MAEVTKVPASLFASERPFSALAGAPAADARTSEENFFAYHTRLVERYQRVADFFKEKPIDVTKVKSFKDAVAEHVAQLSTVFVTTGRFIPPPSGVEATESLGASPLAGFDSSPAMRHAIESGFDPDAKD